MAALASIFRLHGREAELSALDDILARVAEGRAGVAIIEGEAGIGKSRLLAEALGLARLRGFDVAAGRAEELESTRPFGLMASALGCDRSSADPRRAAIAELLSTHTGDRGPITVSSDPGLQFQAVDAFVDVVEALSLHRPLVIALDDLQWADPSSLLTIGALGRDLKYVPVALIGCLRPVPRLEELHQVLAALDVAGARRLALAPLDEQAVVDLVTEAVEAEPGERLVCEVEGAGGNPLFITELLGALDQEGAIRTEGGRAEVAELSLPPTLRLTILRRLSFLPERTLATLRPASVLGSRFSLTELSDSTSRSVTDLSAALEQAIQAGVVEDDGERLAFRHDLIREAIYKDIPGSVRLGLHREHGQRLAQSGAPALQVAEHLARGAVVGDTEAVEWLTRAAREAATRSPTVAADLLEQAIGLTQDGDPAGDQLPAERAGALLWAGRIVDAEAECRALLDRAHDPAVEGRTRLCLARCLVAEGRAREALDELELARSSPMLTDEERVDARGWETMCRLSLGDLDGAAAVAEEVRAAALPGDARSPSGLSISLDALAVVKQLRGQLQEALEITDEAVRLADRSRQRQGHRYPLHATRGHILLTLDRLEDARLTLRTGRRISDELGARLPLPTYEVFLGLGSFFSGDWDDAVAEVESGVELADETGQRYSLPFAHSVLSLIALHRGDLRRAGESIAAAERELAAGPRTRATWTAWARALLLERGGAVPEAYATLICCWDECTEAGLALEYAVLGADVVRLSLEVGERRRAEQAVAAVTGLASRNDLPRLTGAALRCQGLLDADPGVLLAAVAAYAQCPRPLELAVAAEDAGACLAGHGKTDTAVPLLEQAFARYESLEATADTARIEARLRELGIRRGRRGVRRRPRTGWASLTPTERRVVDLVAEGLSNPQIAQRLYVSRRTVQTHLAHVFAKLSVTSRAQLAAEVTRRTMPIAHSQQ